MILMGSDEWGLLSGKTMPTDGSSDENLSIDVLVSDFFNLMQAVFPDPTVAPSLLVSMT